MSNRHKEKTEICRQSGRAWLTLVVTELFFKKAQGHSVTLPTTSSCQTIKDRAQGGSQSTD